MYGSLEDDETGFAGVGVGVGSGKGDPLLPTRGPSTAESRKNLGLKKRVSVSQRNALRTAAAARRRSQLLLGSGGFSSVPALGGGGGAVQQQKPIMKTLFRDNKKQKKSIEPQQQQNRPPPKSSSLALLPPATPLLDIETLQDLVPAAAGGTVTAASTTTSTTNGGAHPPQQQQQQQQQQKGKDPSRPPEEEIEEFRNEEIMQNKKQRIHHSWLYVLLHPNSRHPHAIWYKWLISIIIVLDVAFFVASTEQQWNDAYPKVFYYEEGIVSAIFLLEYTCRIVVAPESRKYSHLSSNWQARFQYMCTTSAIMDAAAALPFFVELPTGLALPNLTWIRFFRLLRILKTGSYARSMQTVYRVIYYNREILYVALNICILLVLVTAVLMYYLRPQNGVDGEENDDFKSLLSTMYLSTLMLTGQGGPDGDNLPWYTKAVILLTGFFSVAMFAIPASMLTWGFEAEAERCARKAQRKYYHQTAAEEAEEEADQRGYDDSNSYSKYVSSSSSEDDGEGGGDTTDEEYLNIIAGGEEEEDGDGEQTKPPAEEEVVKKLIRTFQTSDVDASGSLSMDEFIELMTSPELASMGMIGMATSMGLLAKRVHHLEKELDQSHKKLDQLLGLLLPVVQQQQQQKQK